MPAFQRQLSRFSPDGGVVYFANETPLKLRISTNPMLQFHPCHLHIQIPETKTQIATMLQCIATPRASLRCEEASRSFEDGVSELSVKEQQGQAIQNARELIRNAQERQATEILTRLRARREQILRDIERVDAQLEKKTEKIGAIDEELQTLSTKP
ncbi:Aste57867_17308 [Aphanomyces stellatus]|uniref:Aste57867_17308 protein n=1 Tax=Aphanomyces stellatus TaxID=120398 RepID=A0A485L8E0_9STRA|nr:hypothetical protein As57867_017249 [Aphanomyces stellatus]VFT94064.1 Aste57867_17308 [Aphanomyces stellatus]